MKKVMSIVSLLFSLNSNAQQKYNFYNIGLSDSLKDIGSTRDLGFYDVLEFEWTYLVGGRYTDLEFYPNWDIEVYITESRFDSVQFCYNYECQMFTWDEAIHYFIFNNKNIQIKSEDLDYKWAMVKE